METLAPSGGNAHESRVFPEKNLIAKVWEGQELGEEVW